MEKGADTITVDAIIVKSKLRRVLVIAKREKVKYCGISIMVTLVECCKPNI